MTIAERVANDEVELAKFGGVVRHVMAADAADEYVRLAGERGYEAEARPMIGFVIHARKRTWMRRRRTSTGRY